MPGGVNKIPDKRQFNKLRGWGVGRIVTDREMHILGEEGVHLRGVDSVEIEVMGGSSPRGGEIPGELVGGGDDQVRVVSRIPCIVMGTL